MLYNDDCFDVLKELPNNSIDAVITDPPYGTTGKTWDTAFELDKWWGHIKRVCSGPVVMFADEPFSSQLVVSNIKEFRYEWIWDKTYNSGGLSNWKRPYKHTEDILVFGKNVPYNIQQFLRPYSINRTKTYPSCNDLQGIHKQKDYQKWEGFYGEVVKFDPVRANGRWEKHLPQKKFHIAQKPVELMEWLVKLYTQEGDVVLDPFMGSGTTGVACRNLNRDFIGVEKDENYFALAGDRLAS